VRTVLVSACVPVKVESVLGAAEGRRLLCCHDECKRGQSAGATLTNDGTAHLKYVGSRLKLVMRSVQGQKKVMIRRDASLWNKQTTATPQSFVAVDPRIEIACLVAVPQKD
jgi:hypothetical protein